MSYADKFATRKIVLSLFMTLAVFACLAMFQGVASAQATPPPITNNRLPRPDNFDQGGQVHLLVARRNGTSYLLDAPNATIRIYTPNPTGTLTIESGRNCPSSPEDSGNVSSTFRMFALTATTNAFFNNVPYLDRPASSQPGNPVDPVSPLTSSGTLSCGNDTISWDIGGLAAQARTRSTVAPFDGLFALELDVNAISGFGWNSFKLSLPSVGAGRISFFAGSTDQFALKSQAGSGRGDYRLGFAPGCGLGEDDTASVRLRWFDPDAGESNQGTYPVATRVREYDENNNFTGRIINIPITEGDNERSSELISIKGHHKYMWVWDNINDANGIQFQLPFDSYNTFIDYDQCPSAACAGISYSPAATVPVGTTVTVRVTVTNAGSNNWGGAYYLRETVNGTITAQRRVDADPPPPPVAPGDTHTFEFTHTRATPATILPRYRMLNNNNVQFGPNPLGGQCAARIAWVAGPVDEPVLVVDCLEISISGVRSSISGDVDVRLRFTRGAGGVGGLGDFNHDFQIPNDGNPHLLNTFVDVNELLPHNTYNVQLLAVTTSPGVYTNLDSASLPICMSVNCYEDVVGGDLEPGQTAQLNYGLDVINESAATFSDYEVRVTGSGSGISSPAFPFVISENLVAGPVGRTGFSGQFTATVDWTSTVLADLYYNDESLEDIFEPPQCDADITPQTRPYITVEGGDVSTGGAFESGGCSVGVGPVLGNPYPGGIRTFANPEGHRGSSVDFAAFALGLIDGNGESDGPYGFYSSAVNGGGENIYNTLSFANYPSGADYDGGDVGELGGLLGGVPPAASQCTPDFYAGRPTTSSGSGNINLSGFSADTRIWRDAGASTINISGTIPNARISIYVNGDVHINGPINYPDPASSPWNINSLPYFALIVSGNITVDRSVGEINGLFVAQPRSASEGGVFATCELNSSLNISANQITNLCRGTDFTLNGAVIAKEVRLLRSGHTMFNGNGSANAAEVFNFVPSMVLGIPNFGDPNDDFESLLSLPPVF